MYTLEPLAVVSVGRGVHALSGGPAVPCRGEVSVVCSIFPSPYNLEGGLLAPCP